MRLLILLVNVYVCLTSGSGIPLVSLMKGLGWIKAEMVVANSSVGDLLLRQLSDGGIAIRMKRNMDFNSCRKSGVESSGLLILASDTDKANLSIKCSCQRKPQTSMVLLHNDFTLKQLLSSRMLSRIMKTNGFYIGELVINGSAIMVQDPKFAFTTQHSENFALSDIEILPQLGLGRPIVKPRYNLNGIEVKGLTLDWDPYFTVDDCDSNGQNCQNCHGIMEYQVKAVFDQFNLTVSCNREPTNDWGLVPKTGSWLDPNATFSGVVGGLIEGDYDISVSSWVNLHARFEWLDSPISVVNTHYVLVMDTSSAPSDSLFPLRAFSLRTWLGLLFVLGLVFGLNFLVNICKKKKKLETGSSLTLITITLGLLFVMVSGYYGGVLTSFLIGSKAIPFRTWKEGLQLYPEWKYILIDGMETIFLERVRNKEEEFVEYWNLIQGNPDLRVTNIPAAVQTLDEPGLFFQVSEQRLVSAVRNDLRLVEGKSLKTISYKKFPSAVILRKHSPFKIFFDICIANVRVRRMEAIMRKTVGDLPSNDESGTRVVNIVEMALPFSFMGVSVVVCIGLFLAEKLYHKIAKWK